MQKNLYVVHQHFYHFKKCSLTSEDSKPGKVLFGTNWKVNRSSSSAILVVYSCMTAQPLSQGLSNFNRPPPPPLPQEVTQRALQADISSVKEGHSKTCSYYSYPNCSLS